MENKKRILTPDVLPCGVCRIKNDAYFTLLDANDEYYRIYGYTREEADKAGFSTVSYIIYPPDWQRTIETVAAAEKNVGGVFELEVRGIHRSGAILWTLARGIPDRDDPSCFICMVLNVSERRYKMEQLKKHDEERKILLKQSGRCVFRFDIKGHSISIAQETAAQLNLPETIENVPGCFLENNLVTPESKEDYKNFYDAMLRGDKSGETVIRTIDPRSGNPVWCCCVFSLVTGKTGEPKYTVVSVEDITEQREQQIAFEKWTQYNKAQLEGAHIFYECNITKNRIDHMGGPLVQNIPAEVRGCYDETFQYILKNLIYPEDLVAYRDFFSRDGLCRCFEGGKRHLELEYRRLGKDKKPFWAKANVQLLTEPYTGDIKAFFVLKNIDEKKRRELELQELSQKDALTGLLNRRTVIEQISQLLETSTPLGRHAFVMVDIDHFKTLNDTKGHQFGDRVLMDFAKSLKASLRAEDIIGRIGGDEFVICLRNVQLNQTLEETTAQLCTALSRRLDEQTFISASLGVAVFPKDGMAFDELYQKADIALYEAKRLGRGCCVFYQNDMLEEGWSTYNDTRYIENREAPRDFEPEWTLKRRESDKKNKQARVSLTRRYIKSIQRVFEDLAVMDVTGDYFYVPSYKEGGVFHLEEGSLSKILEKNARDIIYQEDAARFLDFFHWPAVRKSFADGAASISSEFRTSRDGDAVSWSEFTLVPIQIAQRKEIYLCFVKDVTARKNAAEAQSQRRILLGRQMESECYRTIMEQAGMMVLEYTKETNTYYASAQARQFTFLHNTGADGNHYFLTREDVHPDDWEKAENVSKLIHMGRDNAQTTVRLKKTDGCYLWCNVALTVLREKDGKIVRSMITVTDVDKAIADRRELEYRAEYDELTGHYNFSKFKTDAAALLRSRGEKKYALWYCDLRNFKLINDMYGYDFGDQVLRFWANIGSSTMREGEIFARVSGDYFVCLRYYGDRRELEECFQEMSGHLYKYGKDQGKKLRLELVSGVYCIEKNEDLLSIEDMIDRANLAQKSVKRLDGSRVAFYSDEMRRQLLREKEIEAIMVKSLEDGEFKPYFQPMADVQHGCSIFGAEALVRWERPGYGVLTPGEFIPLFEKNGFIVELDRYIFEQVCKYLHGLLENGKSPIKLSVNVSRISALRKDFISRYTEIKERYHIPDGLLELECTETTMVENAELLESVMRKMRIRGFCFSMDDFGSGYSSLNLLKDVTVEVLKLDMMFFSNNKLFEQRNQTIISSIVGMAKALNMKTVAEGVETVEQMKVLKRLGCDYIQGYYIGRPLPVKEFEARFLSPAG